jgi:hypothetical protein
LFYKADGFFVYPDHCVACLLLFSVDGDSVFLTRQTKGDLILIVKCCVCGSTMGKTENNEAEEEISHTYCDNCLQELMDQSHEEDHLAEIFLNRR